MVMFIHHEGRYMKYNAYIKRMNKWILTRTVLTEATSHRWGRRGNRDSGVNSPSMWWTYPLLVGISNCVTFIFPLSRIRPCAFAWHERRYYRQCDNDNRKYSYKYVCITTNQPDTKSKPSPNPNPNPTTEQHAIMNIQLNIVTCLTYPDIVVAPFVLVYFFRFQLSHCHCYTCIIIDSSVYVLANWACTCMFYCKVFFCIKL